MNSLYEHYKVTTVYETAAATATTFVTAYVDMADYVRALFVLHCGAYTTGPTTFTLMRLVQATSAAGAGAKAIPQFTGTAAWIDATQNLNTGGSATPTTLVQESTARTAALEVNAINLDIANSFRYVAMAWTAAVTGTGLTCTVTCIRELKHLNVLATVPSAYNYAKA